MSLSRQRLVRVSTSRCLALYALLTAICASEAAWAQPTTVASAARSFRLGGLELTALRDAQNDVPNDGKILGFDVGPGAVAALLKRAGAPTDKVTLDVDALLVRGNGRVMLIDTGLGPKAQGALTGSLALAGVTPQAVSDIFITHVHFDHVGGLLTSGGQTAFPNAVIHMSAAEWDWMRSQAGNAPLAAVIGAQVRTFRPGAALAPGVTAIALPGHTPGHVGYEIRSQGRRLLDMGDTAHSTIVSLAKPDWAMGYDGDAKLG